MTITNVPELTGTEVLQSPVYDHLPPQVCDPGTSFPPATDFSSNMAYWAVPPHAYACTFRDADAHSTCRGQVLRVGYKGTGDHWDQAFGGVCQNPAHRRALQETMRSSMGGIAPTSIPYELFSIRFPLIHDEQAPAPEATESVPEPTTVTLPGHSELQRRVLEYCIGYDGTVTARHSAFQWLAERDVFYPGRPESLVIDSLEELLRENPMGACSDGLARFRDEFDLSGGVRQWKADVVQSGTGVRIGIVTWKCEADNPSDAEDFFTSAIPLGDIDRHMGRALDELDQGDIVFESDFDVVLSDIEDLGPVD